MYGKIIIHCVLTVKTGLHIGDSSAFSAIGAVDSPVVRDPYSWQQFEGKNPHAACSQQMQGY